MLEAAHPLTHQRGARVPVLLASKRVCFRGSGTGSDAEPRLLTEGGGQVSGRHSNYQSSVIVCAGQAGRGMCKRRPLQAAPPPHTAAAATQKAWRATEAAPIHLVVGEVRRWQEGAAAPAGARALAGAPAPGLLVRLSQVHREQGTPWAASDTEKRNRK